MGEQYSIIKAERRKKKKSKFESITKEEKEDDFKNKTSRDSEEEIKRQRT